MCRRNRAANYFSSVFSDNRPFGGSIQRIIVIIVLIQWSNCIAIPIGNGQWTLLKGCQSGSDKKNWKASFYDQSFDANQIQTPINKFYSEFLFSVFIFIFTFFFLFQNNSIANWGNKIVCIIYDSRWKRGNVKLIKIELMFAWILIHLNHWHISKASAV